MGILVEDLLPSLDRWAFPIAQVGHHRLRVGQVLGMPTDTYFKRVLQRCLYLDLVRVLREEEICENRLSREDLNSAFEYAL